MVKIYTDWELDVLIADDSKSWFSNDDVNNQPTFSLRLFKKIITKVINMNLHLHTYFYEKTG